MTEKAVTTDHRTLAAMERAGFIVRNGRTGETERHWTGSQVPVVTVQAGPKLRNWYDVFEYKGEQYRLRYFDGCFKPFVTRYGPDVKLPSWV